MPLISSMARLTRRTFVSGALAGAGRALAGTPDVTLRIADVTVEVAPGHVVSTTAYNGTAPGPLIRLRESVPVTVEIFNDTDHEEYVHWHGFEIPGEMDGTEEENSAPVPPHGNLRYEMTPTLAGSRYVHSHAMAMDDLTRGIYSGQFAFVYVEPKKNPGRYDREIFLSTHEWQPYFIDNDDDAAGGREEHMGETDWGPVSAEVAYRIRSINGKALGAGEPIRTKYGERILFHIVNASATENIRLYLPGHRFMVTALDGHPVPHPRSVGMLELGASERVDAWVDMTNPGVWILGSPDAEVRGRGLGVLVEYSGRKGAAKYLPPAGPAWDYRLFGGVAEAAQPDEIMSMAIDRLLSESGGEEQWTINGRTYGQDEPHVLHEGRRYRLAFTNKSGEDHPLHLHRHTFELARVNEMPTSGLRKDVALLKAFQTIDIDVTPKQKGLALFHCHQQMHMDQGFKALFKVV